MQGKVRAGRGFAEGLNVRAFSRAGSAVLALIAFVALAEAAFLGPDFSPSARLMAHAGAASSAAFLLYAAQSLVDRESSPWSVCWFAAAGALLTFGFIFATGPMDGRAALLACASFLLVTCFGVLLAALRRLVADPLLATMVIAAFVCLATAAPLWLGPLAELSVQRASIVNAAIAVSPLTYLSMLADFDYLRTGWFYEHTSLGSLRYEYPRAWSLSVVYALPLLAVAGAELGGRLRQRSPR